MKIRYLGNFLLPLIVSLTAACGSSGGSDKDKQYVEISAVSRCSLSISGARPNPDNCMLEEIEEGSFVTDQIAIHLSGTSSVPEDDGCPEPTNFDQAFIPCPVQIFPVNYSMRWTNSSIGASGNGQVGFKSYPYNTIGWNNTVGWNTYDSKGVILGYADPKGIPLKIGPNRLKVTTTNSGLRGIAEITITRVVDVTPPTVHSVSPEPGSSTTSGRSIVVYFSEHLDPASVVTAINVVDDNAQSVAGTSEYDPLKLKVTWRPQSPLNPDSSYTARISGVTDWAPNVMIDPYEWSFTTRPLATDPPAIDPIIITPSPNTPKVVPGRFIGSAVEGLRYETPTQSGLTDVNGIFKYIRGEVVSFYIGDIFLGMSIGATRLTPLNLVPGSDIDDPQVVNILRFVQSLDEDRRPDNGIRIADTVTNQAFGQSLDFSLSTTDFENAANALLTILTSGSVNTLTDASSAQTHFLASLENNNHATIAGAPFCDDWGGTADFGCRIVPEGAPPDIGLSMANDSASISIEIVNQQHIEIIDTDGEREKIAVAVFITNNGADVAAVSMRIGLNDENGSLMGYAIANTFPFDPGYSGLVAFTANPNLRNVSPMIYHGMLLEVEVAGGPLTFGEFRQANIFPVDPTSHVGN